MWEAEGVEFGLRRGESQEELGNEKAEIENRLGAEKADETPCRYLSAHHCCHWSNMLLRLWRLHTSDVEIIKNYILYGLFESNRWIRSLKSHMEISKELAVGRCRDS